MSAAGQQMSQRGDDEPLNQIGERQEHPDYDQGSRSTDAQRADRGKRMTQEIDKTPPEGGSR